MFAVEAVAVMNGSFPVRVTTIVVSLAEGTAVVFLLGGSGRHLWIVERACG